MKHNPNLVEIYDRIPVPGSSTFIFIAGCSLGDDAEWLARNGHDGAAFDMSPRTIDECHNCLSTFSIQNLEADLFNPLEYGQYHYDIVAESTHCRCSRELYGKGLR